MIKFERAKLEDVWNLRHVAMWPDRPIDFIKQNSDSEGIHLGIYENDSLICVLSIDKLSEFAGAAVIRKLCTRPDRQREGLASLLMTHALEMLKEKKIKTVSLDARVYVVPFYKRFGFRPLGRGFVKYGRPFQKMICSFR
ncbi:MAG: GNAT family N-acetyltransferase [Erysipelotrichaceae bacterium]|nr:GNAT family N-acetyltransferase [Erysipelotrichaceae bacterium]